MDIRDLVAGDDLFDPLEEDEAPQEEAAHVEEGEAEIPLIGEPLEEKPEPEEDTRPPRERIYELLGQMPGQKRLLLALIDHCREEKTGEEMNAFTEELQVNTFSVYSPVILRELLEKAGAIRYEGPEAQPDDAANADASAEAPTVSPAAEEHEAIERPAGAAFTIAAAGQSESAVQHEHLQSGEEDVDIEYLEIEEREPGVWVATPEGIEVVDEQDDFGGVKRLLATEPQYLDIYHRILDFCNEEGRSAKEIDNLVNDDPLLEEPRRYSGYFVGRLEREGAIHWANGWEVTETGGKILQMIIEEAAAAAQA